MKNLDRTKLPEILQVMFAVVFTPNEGGKWGLPLILWSDVGWGKSSILKQFARLAWLNIYTLILGQMDQSDMKMDVPIEGQEYMRTVINGEMQKIMEDKNCIIGFDEYSLTDDRLQGLSMSLILERMLGPKSLPSTAVPICLANPVGKGCGVNDTKRPQDDRLTHIDLDKWFPAEDRVAEWRNFQNKTVNKEEAMMQAFVSGDIEDIADYKEERATFDPHAERIRVAKAWAKEFRRADDVVGTFIEANPKLLHPKLEKAYRPKNIDEKSFPTSRSNSKAPRILAAARIHGLSDRMKRCLLEGTMGASWTSAFLIHERNYGLLPNTEDLLDGLEAYKHDKSKPDILTQVLQACVSVLSSTKDPYIKNSRVLQLWTIMAAVYKEDNLCIDQLQPIGDEMMKNGWVKKEHRAVAGPVLNALRFLFVD